LIRGLPEDEKYLKLLTDTGKIDLAFVKLYDKIYILSTGKSRWPASLLRSRNTNLIVGGEKFSGRACLVTDLQMREKINALFKDRYGDNNFSRWFDHSSRLIEVDLGNKKQENSDSYFEWLKEEFESISSDYDRHIFGNRINSFLRERSLAIMERIFPQGSNLMEIGCGTGTETISMLQKGYRITAIDISPRMLDEVNRKAQNLGLSEQLKTHAAKATDIGRPGSPLKGETFDGIYSTYGAMNCEPGIAGLPVEFSRLIRPGGVLFLGMFNRLCASEIIMHLGGLKVQRIFERFRTPVQEGSSRFCIDVFAYSPMYIRKLFSSNFRMISYEAVPLILPPSNYAHQLEKFTGDSRRLEKLDIRLSRLPGLRALGDHFLMWFEKI
jgi:ubiquinone/menaquinone biosynthesis C-methylase UbiE